jgi:hypothetical protein
MSDCKYCGKPAGFLHGKHKECESAHAAATGEITAAIEQAFTQPTLQEPLSRRVEESAKHGFIPAPEKRQLLVAGWIHALEHFVDNGVLEEPQEAALVQFMKQFSLTRDELNASHSFDRMVKAAALREVMHGVITKRCTVTGSMPLNLQKSEEFVWAFPGTRYLEDRTRREYVGHSGGFSVRVARGLYYHASSFKGRPVEITERRAVDVGLFVVTNKNLYFAGPRKSMRIPYPKIVSFQSFSDGMGLVRDAASAKPQVFVTGDGWFTYNLVANLAKL